MRNLLRILAFLVCLIIPHGALAQVPPGAIRTAVILFKFADVASEPFTPSEAEDRIFVADDSLAAFIWENSYHRNWITGSAYGWVTLPGTVASYGCTTTDIRLCGSLGQIGVDAGARAQSAGYVATNFDRVIYVANTLGGGHGDVAAYIGAGSFNKQIIAHEFGHTLGGAHANSISCPNGPPDFAAIAANCAPDTYGDREDPMGSGYQHYSSYNKTVFGFLASDRIAIASVPGTFDLAPLELSSADALGLSVPVTESYAYLFEYRRAILLDAVDINGNPTVDHISVRLQVQGVPSTGATMMFSRHLHLGEVFVDPYHGIAVSVSALTPDHATLQVQRDWNPANDVVDGAAKAGQVSATAFDGSCAQHVLYLGARGRTLKHAAHAADGSWSLEDVDTAERAGSFVSLAVDAAGGLHAAFYESRNRDLKYAYRPAGGSWILETVDSMDRVGQYTSIAVANDGTVHIAYYDYTHRDLRHASRALGGSWQVEAIDGPNRVGTNTAIAVAPSGALYVTYVDATLLRIRLAIQSTPGGSWTIEDVGAAAKRGSASALAVDAGNQLHVAYYDGPSRNLHYAKRGPAGTWTFETIDAKIGVGAQLALTLDSAGAPVVVYRDDKSRVLRTASRSDTGVWTSRVLGLASDDGLAPSLATGCGESAGLHATFYDRKRRALRYADRFTVPVAAPSHLVLIGDFNGDGVVNPFESNRLDALYAGATPTPEELSRVDVNGNGVLDFQEFSVGRANVSSALKRCLVHATETNQRFYLVGDLNQTGTVSTAELAHVANLARGLIVADDREIALADGDADGQVGLADVPIAVESYARSGPLPCVAVNAP